jgi:DNA (cytosine-5)-methyltransferase 1
MPKTAVTLFSGGGLADIGLKAAGFEIIGAVEREPAIAEIYRLNHGDHVIVGSVFHVDYTQWYGADLLHASPPCQAYSVCRDKNLPAHEGADTGYAIIRAVDEIDPRWVTIENVEGYRKSKVYCDIVAHLWQKGYWVVDKLVNAKYHGVPQSRKRLIMVASKDSIYQFPAHEKPMGWHQAIADLLPDCPDTQLAEWQKKKLEKFQIPYWEGGIMNHGCRSKGFVLLEQPSFTILTSHTLSCVTAFLVNDDSKRTKGVDSSDPSPTLLASSNKKVLLQRGGARSESVTPIRENEPAPTIKAMEKWGGSHFFDVIDDVSIKQLTPRCLARLMTVPDDYILPEKGGLACKIIGNGVPCKMMEKIARNLSY